MSVSVAIIGEFDPSSETHAATNQALSHSSAFLNLPVESTWISTAGLDASIFRTHNGLWIAPGSPYKDMRTAIEVIRHAREHGIPSLGTCGGLQHMVIEYARNVLGFRDAQHAEYDPYASQLFISRLACSLVGRQMPLSFVPDSKVAKCYGSSQAVENYYCNFGVHPDRVISLTSKELRIVGSDAEGEARVIELADHPFFVGTLFVPQIRSRQDAPHPLINAFLQTIGRCGS